MVVQELCEILDVYSILDSLNTDQDIATNASYMNNVGIASDKPPTHFNNECGADPNNTHSSAAPNVNYDTGVTNSGNIRDTTSEVIIQFTDATDLVSNNCVRTQVTNVEDAYRNQRVGKNAADLMSYKR
ncbi:hypothetical protein QAD02_021574 [Eretmocerus hayati]|uniref:Uncharacterized protein n=1 Tax=Eretmocerus hayati TaxID=131215 RepID=A0ACC2PSH9_9HYME|nr:hypothetical protein QAD02_021574 [Eretmocerus hayati]